MGIEDILMYDESLFQNINAFDPDYVPPNYNFRDTQMEAMAMAIRPAMRGGQPSSAIVLGSPATGKTTAIRKVFELVEKNTEKVLCVYINCQIHTTRFGIFSQIYKKVFGHLPPETGVPFSRVYDQIMKELQKNEKALVIFAILSDLEFKYAFDKNVNTVFIPQEIHFPLYSYNEVEDILRDRAKAGFYPNVLGDDILEQIAMYTYENGDLRIGIKLLNSCGNIAEADASREITQKHYDEAVDSLVSINISETIKALNDQERELLRMIVSYEDVCPSSELAESFKQKTGSSYASFNRSLLKLEFVRLIDLKFTGKGVRGNSREIILRFNPDDYTI